MSSKYNTINISNNWWKILFNKVENVKGVLVNPKGIIKNSNDLYLVTHVVYGLSATAIYTFQYPDLRSNFANHCSLASRSKISAT